MFAPSAANLRAIALPIPQQHRSQMAVFRLIIHTKSYLIKFLFYAVRQTQCWTHIYFSYLHPDVHLYGHECKELQFLSHNNVSSRQSSPHRQWKLLLPVLLEERTLKELTSFASNFLRTFSTRHITEEISTQCSVSIDHFFYRVQPGIYHLQQFLVR